MLLYDAHNHLHDPRLGSVPAKLLEEAAREGVAGMVVNGSCEEDWPAVLALARKFPGRVLPSFGYHPWYVRERTPEWLAKLESYLNAVPSAVGEIGLDRWVEHHDTPAQEEAFVAQMRLAARRNLPVSIHCLQAGGACLNCSSPGRGPPAVSCSTPTADHGR
jgi:TatD DNase family protein